MFARRKMRQPLRLAPARKRRQAAKPPLDAAGLLLELDMAALIRQAEHTLRQHPEGGSRWLGAWWRRLGKRT
jgi:hypothetical protein